MRRLGDVPRNVRRLPAAFATLERHLAMGVRPQGRHKAPPGTPLDGLMPARRTGQTLLVPVSQDQLKRLGGAVFLDRSASHLEPPASDGGPNVYWRPSHSQTFYLDGWGPSRIFSAPGPLGEAHDGADK